VIGALEEVAFFCGCGNWPVRVASGASIWCVCSTLLSGLACLDDSL
jgi:hypothetical protein